MTSGVKLAGRQYRLCTEQGKSLSFCKLNKEADMEGCHEIAAAD
ncbi:MAG: hypothetical protein V1733_04905 [bacterium]